MQKLSEQQIIHWVWYCYDIKYTKMQKRPVPNSTIQFSVTPTGIDRPFVLTAFRGEIF